MNNFKSYIIFWMCFAVRGAFAEITWITPANGNAPASGYIIENHGSAAIKVEDLTVTGATGKTVFTIVSENGDTDPSNFKFEMNQASLQSKYGSIFDYETAKAYVMVIKVVDSDKPPQSATATVTVPIKKENQKPQFPTYPLIGCVESGAPADTEVGTFTATDHDGNVINYVIVGGDGGNFKVDSVTGLITTTSSAVDANKKAFYTIEYNAKDNGLPSKTATALVRVAVDSPFCDCASAAVSLKGTVYVYFTFLLPCFYKIIKN